MRACQYLIDIHELIVVNHLLVDEINLLYKCEYLLYGMTFIYDVKELGIKYKREMYIDIIRLVE